MPTETRNGKGRYFTVTLRRDGKRVRLYLGKAGTPPAELASVVTDLWRVDAEIARRYWREGQPGSTKQLEANIDAALRALQPATEPAARRGPGDGPENGPESALGRS